DAPVDPDRHPCDPPEAKALRHLRALPLVGSDGTSCGVGCRTTSSPATLAPCSASQPGSLGSAGSSPRTRPDPGDPGSASASGSTSSWSSSPVSSSGGCGARGSSVGAITAPFLVRGRTLVLPGRRRRGTPAGPVVDAGGAEAGAQRRQEPHRGPE